MRTEAAGCQQRLLKRAKKVVELLAYQAEMCGEEQQLNLLLQFMGEYLDYQGRGGEGRERVLASFIPF